MGKLATNPKERTEALVADLRRRIRALEALAAKGNPYGQIEHIGDPAYQASWPDWPGSPPAYSVPNYSNLTATGAWYGLSDAHGRGDTYTFTTTGKCRVVFEGVWGFNATPLTGFLAIEPCAADGTFDNSTEFYVPEQGRDYIRHAQIFGDTANYRSFHHERVFTIGTSLVGTPITWGALIFITAGNIYVNTEGSGNQGQFFFQFFADDGSSKGWTRN